MKTKSITLKTSNTSWWKKKKIRKSSAYELNLLRKLGWKLKKKEVFLKSEVSINTNTFYRYFLYKK